MSVESPIQADRRDRWATRLPRFLTAPQGVVGAVMLGIVLAIVLVGPSVAPHPIDQPLGVPGAGPSQGSPLGLDYLGRDVLSRVLDGGRSVLLLASASTVLVYLVGISIGLMAGYTRSLLDPLLMRGVDVFISFPALLLILVLITGTGPSEWTLLFGIVLVLFPGVARIVRTATLEVSTRAYVESAVTRGERTWTILRIEILPNIVPAILADAGLRFAAAIILAASVSFLGLGLQPPAANWGLMVAENRYIFTENVWAVLVPATLIAALTVSVNLIGDAYIATRGQSKRR
jgi:peptide/nickel transport system permease protein